MKRIMFILLFIISSIANASTRSINVYNWSGYMPDEVIRKFEKETGIQINYSTYDSNETMYAKLKANPDVGYDLVVPSSYFIDRMHRQGMLQKIDKSKLTYLKNINPTLLNKPFDPHNDYSIPYFWGTTGIAINTLYHPQKSITAWADLWRDEYKDQLLLLDDTREVFSIALLTLGYSANDTNPDHIKAAYLKLKQLMPNVKLFNAEAAEAIYIDEDVTIGMGWSGDIAMAQHESPVITYIYPKEGFVIYLDSMAIPKGAKHLNDVYRFINFLMRPDIAAQIALSTGYASPNLAAIKLMPKAVRNNLTTYPDPNTLKRGQFQVDVGSASELYEKYLELLKIGG